MPKMLIDISENDYNTILFHRPCMSKVTVDVECMISVFQNGIVIPDNATNKDVFTAIFPLEWDKVYEEEEWNKFWKSKYRGKE